MSGGVVAILPFRYNRRTGVVNKFGGDHTQRRNSSKMAKENVTAVAAEELKAEETKQPVSQVQKALEATEALAAMDDSEQVAEEVQEQKIPKLYVVRRRYTNKNDGKQYWEYIVPVVFCDSISEVHFKASDVDGYRALEKMFDRGLKKAELQVREERSYDEKTGLRKYYVYEVVCEIDGFEWRYPLRTSRGSDKAVMENYIRFLKFEAERSKAQA